MTAPRLGTVQARIMQFLWQSKRASAREITDALNREKPIAHSTVQTLLRKLEDKGAVGHEVEDRTFIFYPLIAPQDARQRATRDLLDRLFNGSATGLITHLVKHESLSNEDRERLHELIKGLDTDTNEASRRRGGEEK